jgi:hypothetical protein
MSTFVQVPFVFNWNYGTATAEFTPFGRVARQIISKPVVSLIVLLAKISTDLLVLNLSICLLN